MGTLAVHWIFLHTQPLLLQDDPRLVKQRRALLESHSPRNSQPETHRDDEPGGGSWVAPRYRILAHRTDRSPDAGKNSSLRRSKLLRCRMIGSPARTPPVAGIPAPSAASGDWSTARWSLRCSRASALSHRIGSRRLPPSSGCPSPKLKTDCQNLTQLLFRWFLPQGSCLSRSRQTGPVRSKTDSSLWRNRVPGLL